MLVRNMGALSISNKTLRLWAIPFLTGIAIIPCSFGISISAAEFVCDCDWADPKSPLACLLYVPTLSARLGDLLASAAPGWQLHKLSWFLPSPSFKAAPPRCPLQVVTGVLALNWHSLGLGKDPSSCCHSQLFLSCAFWGPLEWRMKSNSYTTVYLSWYLDNPRNCWDLKPKQKNSFVSLAW